MSELYIKFTNSVSLSVCPSDTISFFAIYSKKFQATHFWKILKNHSTFGIPSAKYCVALIKKIFLQTLVEKNYKYKFFVLGHLGTPLRIK